MSGDDLLTVEEVGDGRARFRRRDVEGLPPNFEPFEAWEPGRDDAGGQWEYVEA